MKLSITLDRELVEWIDSFGSPRSSVINRLARAARAQLEVTGG